MPTYNLKEIILNFIYPEQKVCLNCGQIMSGLNEVEGLCKDCLEKIEFVSDYCSICGRRIDKDKNSFCQYCLEKIPFFDRARSIAVYQGVIRDLILKFKYYKQIELASIFKIFLEIYFCEYYDSLSIDYILPVPLHENREKTRGYNQAGLLAEELAYSTKIPVLNNYILRIKNSLPLYKLSLNQRLQMVKGIFSINDNAPSLAGCSVLLIDDILTTGTTTNEISRILKQVGKVKEVYVLTLATADLSIR